MSNTPGISPITDDIRRSSSDEREIAEGTDAEAPESDRTGEHGEEREAPAADVTR